MSPPIALEIVCEALRQIRGGFGDGDRARWSGTPAPTRPFDFDRSWDAGTPGEAQAAKNVVDALPKELSYLDTRAAAKNAIELYRNSGNPFAR